MHVTGITIELEKFPNFAKEGQKEMTIVDISNNEDDFVRFKGVSDSSSSWDENSNILDSVRNTGSSEVRRRNKEEIIIS